MDILRVNHWTEVWESYGRVRGKIEGAEGVGNSIEISKVLTNPDPWKLPEIKDTNQGAYIGLSMAQAIYAAGDCFVWPQWEMIAFL